MGRGFFCSGPGLGDDRLFGPRVRGPLAPAQVAHGLKRTSPERIFGPHPRYCLGVVGTSTVGRGSFFGQSGREGSART